MAEEGKQDDGGDPHANQQKTDKTAVSAKKSMNSPNNSIKDHLLVIILMMIISCIIGAAITSLVICEGITDCSRQDHKPFVQTKTTNSSILTLMQSMTETMETVTVPEDTMATISVPADTMATITVAADIRCPNHFVRLSTGCYFFSPSHELKSWHETYH